MTATRPRTGGCGCGGHSDSSRGTEDAPCGCQQKSPCGCEPKRPPEVPGGCQCEGPERCGTPCLERSVYHPGQLLTADSLRLGQQYVERRLELRRFVDGVGVVCGLHVRCSPDEPGWIVVEPGYAVDCCGQDIVVCDPVRFNLCKAIAECPQPIEPCEDLGAEQEEEAPAGGDALPPAEPEAQATIASGRTARIQGRITDAATGDPIEGATVRIVQPIQQTQTDADGRYTIEVISVRGGEYKVIASATGYVSASRKANVKPKYVTIVDFELDPIAEPKPAAPEYDRYVLRIEGTWEGRAPVPVVTSRGACDPRPDCRPSKEVGSVRLCVEPLQTRSPESVVKDRTKWFRETGHRLFARIAEAIAAAPKKPDPDRDPDPEGRAIADALLSWMRERPLRSSCALPALVCDLRRKIMKQAPYCFPLTDVDPIQGLVDVVGRILDDFREDFLTRGCDDCCERVGVRVAEVWTHVWPPECGQGGCGIAGIDTHAPAREALHPHSSWWYPSQVAVYDAYFRGAREAAVLLTARGLTVAVNDATKSQAKPDGLPDSVEIWIKDHGGRAELARLALYQDSVLYVDYSSDVTLWIVGDRVIAITEGGANKKPRAPRPIPAPDTNYFAMLPGHVEPMLAARRLGSARLRTLAGRFR